HGLPRRGMFGQGAPGTACTQEINEGIEHRPGRVAGGVARRGPGGEGTVDAVPVRATKGARGGGSPYSRGRLSPPRACLEKRSVIPLTALEDRCLYLEGGD